MLVGQMPTEPAPRATFSQPLPESQSCSAALNVDLSGLWLMQYSSKESQDLEQSQTKLKQMNCMSPEFNPISPSALFL